MLSKKDLDLHEHGLQLSRNRHLADWLMIEHLQTINRLELYRKFELGKIFLYVMKYYEVSRATAYCLISVAEKCGEIPELQQVLKSQQLVAAKAYRLMPILKKQNAQELIDFALSHTYEEVDKEIARRNPKKQKPDRVKDQGGGKVRLEITVTDTAAQKLERARSVQAQKNKPTARGEVLEEALDVFLYHKDPQEKAKRAKIKKPFDTSPGTGVRKPTPAHVKHEVRREFDGRCGYIFKDGTRCTQDRHLAIHHIKPVSEGGNDHPDNLMLLCWHHHDLVHQLELPFDAPMANKSAAADGNRING